MLYYIIDYIISLILYDYIIVYIIIALHDYSITLHHITERFQGFHEVGTLEDEEEHNYMFKLALLLIHIYYKRTCLTKFYHYSQYIIKGNVL